eukprot:CAMPEP_0119056084 /NCGR_PEP_ID=MMETSP1178-20130426/797_1 /TAXON_ID=33656 /ORGANISM="unid sp, Strain CCMP2000" /LENGTH=255 /DNA_ID=CAMNT_0007036777 /DNA_START=50 /DNA_END=811 /DNA_ORIENTATION=-
MVLCASSAAMRAPTSSFSANSRAPCPVRLTPCVSPYATAYRTVPPYDTVPNGRWCASPRHGEQHLCHARTGDGARDVGGNALVDPVPNVASALGMALWDDSGVARFSGVAVRRFAAWAQGRAAALAARAAARAAAVVARAATVVARAAARAAAAGGVGARVAARAAAAGGVGITSPEEAVQGKGPADLAPGDLDWPSAQVLDDLVVAEALVDVLEHDEPSDVLGELGGRHGGGRSAQPLSHSATQPPPRHSEESA